MVMDLHWPVVATQANLLWVRRGVNEREREKEDKQECLFRQIKLRSS